MFRLAPCSPGAYCRALICPDCHLDLCATYLHDKWQWPINSVAALLWDVREETGTPDGSSRDHMVPGDKMQMPSGHTQGQDGTQIPGTVIAPTPGSTWNSGCSRRQPCFDLCPGCIPEKLLVKRKFAKAGQSALWEFWCGVAARYRGKYLS